MILDPAIAAKVISFASDASGVVAALLKQIMAAALAKGVAYLPTAIHEVAVVMEGKYPNEATLIADLEKILDGYLPAAPVTP